MTDTPRTNREVHLVSRPVGEPGPENFTVVDAAIPELGEGQVLVRNTWMSVDPYMRGRMNDRTDSYIPPFALGEALSGGATGVVVESRAAATPVGTTVMHQLGWRDYAVLDATTVTPIDTSLAPAEAYLGVLGMPGLTAYAGLVEVAPVAKGDVVFVSGAAGAVGSVAGQIARQLGASRVIGSAGGPEKARKLVEDFGFDAAIDYRAGSVAEQLAAAAPEGIDVYFDNVGGEHLEAAIGAMRPLGRIALCGAISQYNATEPVPGPSNLVTAIGKQLTLKGMLVGQYFPLAPQYIQAAAGWLASGALRSEQTVFEGIDRAPDAFLGMMRGANIGKMLVHLAAA
ncbi:NADP-dependent oxidoreductase [Streptacidiphilus rugosus]|uniref:NADP-dependent oxidoreductase n=1 Tax=Streptacidiphilus rugosus TaxID=405783 RepID=UPI00056B2877|nr:NADP-dependent oxidoreductase [Streptacidiphilus rugosus]